LPLRTEARVYRDGKTGSDVKVGHLVKTAGEMDVTIAYWNRIDRDWTRFKMPDFHV
jgi:hypothetical protein